MFTSRRVMSNSWHGEDSWKDGRIKVEMEPKAPKRYHVVGDAETVLQRRLMQKLLG